VLRYGFVHDVLGGEHDGGVELHKTPVVELHKEKRIELVVVIFLLAMVLHDEIVVAMSGIEACSGSA